MNEPTNSTGLPLSIKGCWVDTCFPHNIYLSAFAVFSNSLLVGTEREGIYRSTDNGATWVQTNVRNTDIYAFAIIGSTVFAAGKEPRIYRSDDNGASWTDFRTNDDMNEINDLVVFGNTLFAGNYNGVFRSADNGQTWRLFNVGLPGGSNNYVAALAAGPGDRVFAGTLHKGIFISKGGYHMDYGSSPPREIMDAWEAPDQTGLPAGMEFGVNGFIVCGRTIFARTGLGLYRSEGIGNFWGDARNDQFPKNTFIAASAVDQSVVFLATTAGIYAGGDKVDNSTIPPRIYVEWSGFNNSGLPKNADKYDFYPYALAVCGDYLFAGIRQQGIWRYQLR